MFKFRHDEASRGVVVAVALEIVLQTQAEAHVIRAPGFAARPDLEAGFLIGARALIHQRVVDGLEIAEAVEIGDCRAHRMRVQRLADQRLHLRHDGFFVALGFLIDAHELDLRQAGLARRAARQILVVRRIADPQCVARRERGCAPRSRRR